MPQPNALTTADVLAWADLHGIDSHGISMMTEYDAWRRAGRINLSAEPRVVRDFGAGALIDGGGGMGHVSARAAMQLAIDKAQALGVGVVAVRNSSHFGACGYFARMATDRGLFGLVTTSVSGIRVAPTGGAQARLGTDPLAFAAPTADGRPFLLDMATTTVAAGKIRNRANEGQPCPPGWVLDRTGQPSTDPNAVLRDGGFMTSLGGTPQNGSYKGYGLAMMINILSCCLSGATLITDPQHTRKPQGMDIGHCLIALNANAFRDDDGASADVQTLCEALRSTPPLDAQQPVMVAGDPERAHAARRAASGIPIEPALRLKLQRLAADARTPWLLGS